jgi:two-component system nitrate/nitrite sensor histidine kinase NarX
MAIASDKSSVPSVEAQARLASLRAAAPGADKGVVRILLAARLVAPLGILGFSLLVALLAALLLDTGLDRAIPSRLLAVSVISAIIALVISALRLRSQLLRPLVALEASVGRVCQGDPGATLSLGETGVLGDLVRDVDSLNEELSDLYEDMDSRVARHTTRLAQKTASLKILYDVAASINQAQDLDELLIRFMRVLKEMVNGLAATVRLVMPDGKMRLVGSIGLDNSVLREEQMLPLQLCLCGIALSPGDIMCVNHAKHCAKKLGRQMFDSDEIEVISVPLEYHDDVLGLYHIFVRKPGISGREDIMELLETIGSHLGMAVAKQQSDDEARRLSIVEERTALAHELHDSLAQTLASLRFQVRMLGDSLAHSDASQRARDDLQKIRSGLDEAHTELRELLSSFRAPMDQRGLLAALEKLVQRFQQETGVHSFFQRDCRLVNLNASEEMQILRIVQESLANIRKHARAQTVRVLLTCRTPGSYTLLVEDDGVGFDNAERKGRPGEHIGLSIMDERARRLGGELRIESEPGEGTRVELTYRPQPRPKDVQQRRMVP